MAEIERYAKKLDVRGMVFAALVTALAFVMGLFWNDAIKSTIEELLPKGEGLFYKYIAAIVVTAFVVLAIYIIIHGQKIAERRIKEIEEFRKLSKKKREKLLKELTKE